MTQAHAARALALLGWLVWCDDTQAQSAKQTALLCMLTMLLLPFVSGGAGGAAGGNGAGTVHDLCPGSPGMLLWCAASSHSSCSELEASGEAPV